MPMVYAGLLRKLEQACQGWSEESIPMQMMLFMETRVDCWVDLRDRRESTRKS